MEGNITASMLFKLLERQGYCCAYTGRRLTPETASVDHILPLSRGGSNDIDNIQVVCNQINRAKGTMTHQEFLAMCVDVTHWNKNKPPKTSCKDSKQIQIFM